MANAHTSVNTEKHEPKPETPLTDSQESLDKLVLQGVITEEEYENEYGITGIDYCNVFIKYLPTELTDSGLYTMFSDYGEVISCKVMVDPQTGNSLGYG